MRTVFYEGSYSTMVTIRFKCTSAHALNEILIVDLSNMRVFKDNKSLT